MFIFAGFDVVPVLVIVLVMGFVVDLIQVFSFI